MSGRVTLIAASTRVTSPSVSSRVRDRRYTRPWGWSGGGSGSGDSGGNLNSGDFGDSFITGREAVLAVVLIVVVLLIVAVSGYNVDGDYSS